ncbi:MAG: ABC transporter substrate-binding protein [Acetobacteraceae bacterium]
MMTGLGRRSLLKLAGTSAAAASGLPAPAMAQKAGVLRVGLSASDLGVLHPHIATSASDTAIISSIFSGLLRFTPPKVSLEALAPDLAESWTASDDRKTFTFHLRRGVKWHQGYGEVTSDDARFSLEWVRDNPQSTFRALYANVGRVDAPDRYTVIVQLKKADPVFQVNVADWHGGYIICKKAVQELGDKYRSQPIGSGPFQFHSYQPKQDVTLTANPDYFRGHPKLNQVIYSYIPDDTSRRFAFVRQQVDMIAAPPTADWLVEVQKATPDHAVVDLLGPTRMVSVSMKESVKPLNSLLVRQAIAHALNREDYVRFFGRVFIPCWSATPPEYFGTPPENKIPADLIYRFDPGQSKKLLARAGHPKGFKLETIISERVDYLSLAQLAQGQLAKVGIKLKLNVVDQSTYVSGIIKNNRGSLVWSTAARFPSADKLMREFWLCAARVDKPTGVQNFALYCNPKFDAAYEAGVTALDPAVRARYFAEAEFIVLKDLPSVTLGGLATAVMRQGYVDLGYPVATGETILSLSYMYHITERTSV